MTRLIFCILFDALQHEIRCFARNSESIPLPLTGRRNFFQKNPQVPDSGVDIQIGSPVACSVQAAVFTFFTMSMP
jgi:hypothetical protein